MPNVATIKIPYPDAPALPDYACRNPCPDRPGHVELAQANGIDVVRELDVQQPGDVGLGALVHPEPVEAGIVVAFRTWFSVRRLSTNRGVCSTEYFSLIRTTRRLTVSFTYA